MPRKGWATMKPCMAVWPLLPGKSNEKYSKACATVDADDDLFTILSCIKIVLGLTNGYRDDTSPYITSPYVSSLYDTSPYVISRRFYITVGLG
jgi:hypothetical protein